MSPSENKNNIFEHDKDELTNNDDAFKGKNALDVLHKNILKENEKNINLKISDIYGVDYDEAFEIHVNYHDLRIKKIIDKTSALADSRTFISNNFDLKNLSSKVASGDITENTCIDILIKFVKNKKESKIKDRYINFYS